MTKAHPRFDEAIEHERALYSDHVQKIRQQRRAKTRGGMEVIVDPVATDDEARYCLELAEARIAIRIDTLAVVPELGSEENLEILLAEIEREVHLHYAAILGAVTRQRASAGRPEVQFEAERARLERHSQSTASEAVATAKRKLRLAKDAQQFGLPAGIGTPAPPPLSPLVGGQSMPDFHFIADPAFRNVLERDYKEIERALKACCWKSVIILSGGAIEALLLDLLQRSSAVAVKSACASKSGDISRWDLKDLISVAVDCKLIGASVEKLSNPVREFRNLIHPGNEVRNKLKFDAEEARIAFEVLNIVRRELS